MMNILVSRALVYAPLGTKESCELDKPVKISALILESVRERKVKIDAKSRLKRHLIFFRKLETCCGRQRIIFIPLGPIIYYLWTYQIMVSSCYNDFKKPIITVTSHSQQLKLWQRIFTTFTFERDRGC